MTPEQVETLLETLATIADSLDFISLLLVVIGGLLCVTALFGFGSRK